MRSCKAVPDRKLRVAKADSGDYCQDAMALADRDYQREEYHPPRYTMRLIVVLLVAFLIQSVLAIYHRVDITKVLALSLPGLRHGWVWQLITFQFMHSVPLPWHVLFNCVGLYFFGRPVEERLGSRRFLWLYLLCGVVGGLLHVAVTATLHQKLGIRPEVSVVGASAGVCGVLAVFCALNPMHEILFYFFPLRARYLLWFVAGLSLYGTIVPYNEQAHAAHLGGILLGLVYVRWFHETDRLAHFWSRFLHPRGLRPVVKVRFPKALQNQSNAKNPRTRDLGPTDFISKEVDPILEKISAHGIHSLTERERKILEAARSKMEKR